MEPKLYSSNFSREYGPDSLFTRVEDMFEGNRTLRIQGKHIKNRLTNEYISTKILQGIEAFNSHEWTLIQAEVRNDTGRLVNSTWEKPLGEESIRIVIGFRDTVKSIEIDSEFKLFNKLITKDGYIYEHVDRSNKKLLEQRTAML